MKYSLSIHTFLFLLSLSDSFAIDPRAVALQRRTPGFLNCCLKATGPVPESSDFLHVPETSTEQRAFPPEASGDQPETLALEIKPYPTRAVNPKLLLDGSVRYIVGVIALNRKQTSVLLVRDRLSTDGWRFPESDWATHEKSPEEAVAREAWETAGIDQLSPLTPISVGSVKTKLETKEGKKGETTDQGETQGQPPDVTREENGEEAKKEPNVDTMPGWSTYYQFPVEFRNVQLRSEWPGQARWDRKWALIPDAAEDLAASHPEQVEMLQNIKLDQTYKYPRRNS